ncbi:hypothetical protein, partial [Bacteroides acidifaciens]|uniref:hypothetical protein n=1 Tax=Bacteroides acidifaciens TaxID=85831 RepID=UPI0019F9304C
MLQTRGMVVPGNEYDSARLWKLLCQAIRTGVSGRRRRLTAVNEPVKQRDDEQTDSSAHGH